MPKKKKNRSPGPFARYLRGLRGGRKLLDVSMEAEDVSVSYLSDLETGARENPSADKLLALARVYGVPTFEMLTRAGKVTPADLYPKINSNPKAKDIIPELVAAFRDPLFPQLAIQEFHKHGEPLDAEAQRVCLRNAGTSVAEYHKRWYYAAIQNPEFGCSKGAHRKRKSTPEEAKALIAELCFKYVRCRTMYRNLHQAAGFGMPKEGWV
jgi:transcriptional regulator with XRE-family HTH domain